MRGPSRVSRTLTHTDHTSHLSRNYGPGPRVSWSFPEREGTCKKRTNKTEYAQNDNSHRSRFGIEPASAPKTIKQVETELSFVLLFLARSGPTHPLHT